MTTIKIDENTIEVTKSETKEIVTKFTYGYLLEQKAKIQAQKDTEIALRDAEIAEVDTLLLECEILGIIVEPLEEIKN